jgi:hypothetical protein
VRFCAFWGFSGAGILKKRTHLSFRINRFFFRFGILVAGAHNVAGRELWGLAGAFNWDICRMDRLDSSEAWRVAGRGGDWVDVDEGAEDI